MSSTAARASHLVSAAVLVLGVLLGACASDLSERDAAPATALATATSLGAMDARLERLLRTRGAGDGFEREGGAEPRFTSPGGRDITEGWTGLAAQLPARADGALEIGVGQLPSQRLRLMPRDATSAKGVLRDGHVVYPAAFGHRVDVVVTTTRESIEELFVLREPTPHVSFAWDVELSSGIARVLPTADGSLRIEDSQGEQVLRVPPPYAVDANGEKREARLTWDDRARVLSVELDPRGLAYPVLLDPAFEVASWAQAPAPQKPPARLDHAMAYDAARGRVVVLGGSNFSLVLGDMWTWDGTTWTQSAASLPPARTNHAMVYDAARGVVLLFGGFGVAGAGAKLNDTWTWNGTTWTKAAPASSPSLRDKHALAYDAARARVVLFGGANAAGTALNDTWTWDGMTWTQANPSVSPSARSAYALAGDPARGRVVLFGGVIGTSRSNETWTWNGSTWSQAIPVTSPPARDSHALAYDATRSEIVLFGGDGTSGAALDDTWTWDGTTWKPMNAALHPSARAAHAMAHDAARGRMVVFGGFTTALTNETWLYYTRGGSCATGSQCGSGFCVDGVCCDVSTCGSCQACNGATPGSCTPITSAPDPDTCTGTQLCDATGTCKASLGQGCAASNQCASGFCTDGVCCESTCSGGLCEACSAALKTSGPSGTCGPAKNGVDPRSDCPDDGSATCQRDGQCDGAGACRRYGLGVSCGSSTCSQNRATGRVCNGLGACGNSTAGIDCSPYVCDGAAGGCANSCTTDDHCVIGNYCDSGVCKPRRAYGAACTSAAGCPVGGSCADGVCCNTACQGQCEACDSPSAAGTCIPLQGAPHSGRAACAVPALGEDVCSAKTCDGFVGAACKGFVGTEKACRSTSCLSGVATIAASCTGRGTCQDLVTVTCAPYRCAGAACGRSCESDAECDESFRCDGLAHACVPRGAASCDGDHTLLVPNGTESDCAPYKCEGSGCKPKCDSIRDCAFPNECAADHTCVPPLAAPVGTNSGGCTAGGTGARNADFGIGAALAALLLVARRRRVHHERDRTA